MTYRIGDTLFNAVGKPGVMVGRSEDGESLRIETEGENLESARHRGYINGLSPEERELYNAIVDEARAQPEVKARVEHLQEQVEAFRHDPRQQNLTRYLEAELAHTMNSTGFQSKEYVIPEIQVI